MIYAYDLERICNAKIFGNKDLILDNFSNDTRTINKDDIYVGIKGENNDGNLLFEQAFEKGAKAAILEHIDEDKLKLYNKKTIILVDNSITALQELAKYKRSLFKGPVIAITGSVGKTSTKEMIASVLEQKYKVLKTNGNNNNHIGLPLTILRLKDEEVMVLEMGMNHLGEISLLTNIAKPNMAVITNIGTAHIGNLGSRENILRAKLEIIEGLNGPLVINNDNDMLHQANINNEVITIGIDNKSNYQAKDINDNESYSTFRIDNEEFKINIPGKVFIYNSLIAYAIGKYYHVDIKDIKTAINDFSLVGNRLSLKTNKKGVTIIDDTYNASYDSVKNALEFLDKYKGKRKIAVLGDILELGDYSKEIHSKIGYDILNTSIEILITIGENSKYINEITDKKLKNSIYHFDKEEECHSLLDNLLQPNDVILIKGSHGIHLDNLVKYLLK